MLGKMTKTCIICASTIINVAKERLSDKGSGQLSSKRPRRKADGHDGNDQLFQMVEIADLLTDGKDEDKNTGGHSSTTCLCSSCQDVLTNMRQLTVQINQLQVLLGGFRKILRSRLASCKDGKAKDTNKGKRHRTSSQPEPGSNEFKEGTFCHEVKSEPQDDDFHITTDECLDPSVSDSDDEDDDTMGEAILPHGLEDDSDSDVGWSPSQQPRTLDEDEKDDEDEVSDSGEDEADDVRQNQNQRRSKVASSKTPKKKRIHRKSSFIPLKFIITENSVEEEYGGFRIVAPYEKLKDAPTENQVFRFEKVKGALRVPAGFVLRCTFHKEGCDMTFKTLKGLNFHVRHNHEELKFKCPVPVCNESFRYRKTMQRHIKKEHGLVEWKKYTSQTPPPPEEAYYKCPYPECGRTFITDHQLNTHRKTVHPQVSLNCEHCSETFTNQLKKETHIEKHHPECPPLPCDQCSKRFFRKYTLTKHQRVHNPSLSREHVCGVCEKGYYTTHDLRRHQITVHNQILDLPSFKCEICPELSFHILSRLQKHRMEKHEGKFQHSCQICGKGFTYPNSLKWHMVSHTGERAFKCDLCDARFAHKYTLKTHLLAHEGKKPFTCEVCGMSFVRECKLTNHFLVHSTDRPFVCSQCGKSFKYESYLRVHMKKWCSLKTS